MHCPQKCWYFSSTDFRFYKLRRSKRPSCPVINAVSREEASPPFANPYTILDFTWKFLRRIFIRCQRPRGTYFTLSMRCLPSAYEKITVTRSACGLKNDDDCNISNARNSLYFAASAKRARGCVPWRYVNKVLLQVSGRHNLWLHHDTLAIHHSPQNMVSLFYKEMDEKV